MSDSHIDPSLPSVNSNDEYPQVTQVDLDRAKFRVGFEPAPRKPRAITSWTSHAKNKEGDMNGATVPYELGLLEDLADPDEATAYLEAALEDGDRDVIQLALQDVVAAQERRQDDGDLRFSPEGLARIQARMAQAEESIKAGKTLSGDEFWRQAYARADAHAEGQATAPSLSTAPAIAKPKVDYTTNDE